MPHDHPDVHPRILDAAVEVFSSRGVRNGTLQEVARRAGISRATLYRQVEGKNALLGRVILREARRLFELLDEELAGTDDPKTIFERGVVVALDHLRTHPLLQKVLREEPETLLPLLTVDAAPLLEAAVAFGAPYVERAVKTERMPPVEPRMAAEWGARILLSLLLTPSVSVDLNDPEQVRRFVAGLGPPGMDGGA